MIEKPPAVTSTKESKTGLTWGPYSHTDSAEDRLSSSGKRGDVMQPLFRHLVWGCSFFTF